MDYIFLTQNTRKAAGSTHQERCLHQREICGNSTNSLVVTFERALRIKEYAFGVFVYISGAFSNVKTDAIMEEA